MSRNIVLYCTTFVCGLSVMAVELSAARLIAPYYGSSQVTWTVLIGVIMAALALGNFFGGRWADGPDPDRTLFRLIWSTSVWMAAIPVVGKYVIIATFLFLMWLFPESLLVAGVIASCLCLFAVPCFLLGAATPCLIRLGVPDMDQTGRVAGRLYALSTLGSIVGTFLPTFLTIPAIGTVRTFFVFALLLNLTGLWFFRSRMQNKPGLIVTAVILIGLLFGWPKDSFAFWKTPLWEGESSSNYLQVVEESGGISLSTHVEIGRQSVYLPDHRISGSYWEYALAAAFMRPQARWDTPFSALVLGFGAGTFAKQARHFFPQTTIQGVEVDGKIVELAGRFFGHTPDDAQVFVDDGRAFLRRPECGKYHLIFLDAYQDVTPPFHLSTREFFREVREHLHPDGIIVMNVNMRFGGVDGLLEYLAQTLGSVMPHVYRYDMPEGLNSILFAPLGENACSDLAANIKPLSDQHPLFLLFEGVRDNLQEVKERRLLLTDEVAPVELISQTVLNALVQDGLREVFVRMFPAIAGVR